MKKLLITLIVFVMAMTIVMAIGPYNSLKHRQDGVSPDGSTHVLANWLGDALELKNKGGEKFVQWFNGKQYIVHCTDGMNPDAIDSKLGEGWTIWHPSTSDPRYDWCPNHEFIYRMG